MMKMQYEILLRLLANTTGRLELSIFLRAFPCTSRIQVSGVIEILYLSFVIGLNAKKECDDKYLYEENCANTSYSQLL